MHVFPLYGSWATCWLSGLNCSLPTIEETRELIGDQRNSHFSELTEMSLPSAV